MLEAEVPKTSLRFKQTKAQAWRAVNPTGTRLPGETQWSEKSLYSVFPCLKGKWETWARLFPNAENEVETFCPGAGAMGVCGISFQLHRIDVRIWCVLLLKNK